MGVLRQGRGTRRFNPSGYEILDQDIAYGEVVIWSTSPVRPRIGDLYLIESGGLAYDAEVEELTTFKGGWSAVCRADVIV
jgi:hypothetical protein